MKKTVFAFFAMVGLILVGCAKDNSQPATTPDQQYPGWLQPGACAAGQVYTQQYGCLPQNTCPANQGYYNGQCIPGSVPPGGYGGYGNYGGPRFAATFATITNRSLFQSLLAYSGGCTNSNHWWSGNNKCSNYSDKGYVVINSPAGTIGNGSQFLVDIVGGANTPNDPYYSGSGWMVYPIKLNIPMVYNATGPAGNPNQGFALSDGSQFNYPTGRIRVRADSGSLTAPSINIILEYNGYEFARTTVYRW